MQMLLTVLLAAVVGRTCFGQQLDDGYCPSTTQDCGLHQPIPPRPNIVLMLADDLGYGDLASYGNPIQEPGPLDEMARMGVKFTQFYSADSLCSPSRAGLLTGRLPIRSGIVGGRRVFLDFDTGGLPAEEVTIAEAFRDKGYTTGFVGKWHLGINNKSNTDGVHLPGQHGFDFVGHNLPLSDLWQCDESKRLMKDGPDQTKCYVYKGDRIVQQPISHSTLTDRFVNDFRYFLDSVAVADEAKSSKPKPKPFFFYFSFSQVHTSLETAARFRGSSKRGPFGDSVRELQDAVGSVLAGIRDRGLEQNTLVLFLSDHGPHREACTFGGSTGGLRGGKGNSFEGGVRVPAVAYWPSVIKPGGVSSAVLSSLDLLPSLISLADGEKIAAPPGGEKAAAAPPGGEKAAAAPPGGEKAAAAPPGGEKAAAPPGGEKAVAPPGGGGDKIPTPLRFDGLNALPALLNLDEPSLTKKLEKRTLYFYCNDKLAAVRHRSLKLHLLTSPEMSKEDKDYYCPHGGRPLRDWYKAQACADADMTRHDPPLVYDLHEDPYEEYPLDEEATKTVWDKVRVLVEKHRKSVIQQETQVNKQLGMYDPKVIPCCDPPRCKCDYP